MTVILSGDTTRRNVPGNAFRRAKARLEQEGTKADRLNKRTRATGATNAGDTVGGTGNQASSRTTSAGTGGSSGSKQQDEGKLGDELTSGAHLNRHKPGSGLSIVPEEGAISPASSFVNSTRTFGGRDLESGGGSGNFVSPMVLSDSADEETPTRVDVHCDSKDMLWSPILPGKNEESADDNGSNSDISSRRGLSTAARVANFSSSVWREQEDHGDSSGGDDSPIPPRRRGGEGSSTLFSVALDRQRATTNLSDSTNVMSGSVSNDARAHKSRSWEDATRGGTPDVDPSRGASAGRGRWPKSMRRKEHTGQGSEDRGSRGGGNPVRPTVRRSSGHNVDIINYSSGEETESKPTTTTGYSSRSHRRDSLKDSSTWSGVNAHSHSTARRKRHESTRLKSSPDKAADSLAGSSLEDVRALLCDRSEYW